MNIDDSKYQTFAQAAHKAAQYNLVQCSSGNLSWRVTPDKAMLSASGAWLAELTTDQIALCDLASGQCVNRVKPTCEAGFHLGILNARPDMNVVLHFQTPYATALACGEPEKVDFNVIIEIPLYIKHIAVVDYNTPGSTELADAVIQALSDTCTHMVILKNHGLVTVGTTFDNAIQKAAFFELACQIRLTNPIATTLPPDAAAHLRSLSQEGNKALPK